MLAQSTPGVYFQWVDSRAREIDLVRTDVAAFVGIAVRGPLHLPVKIESWTQFLSTFGGHTAQGYLAYAVEGFLANGGRTCWVVRVADPNAAAPARLDLDDTAGRPSLCIKASSPGVWGRGITVRLVPAGSVRFSLSLRLASGEEEFWHGLTTALASLELMDREGLPTLRLSAYDPRLWFW
ncbi:MAG: hypothetical protein GY856_15740, partial [bacterium]|nr:hypothetical protein [bacterium]